MSRRSLPGAAALALAVTFAAAPDAFALDAGAASGTWREEGTASWYGGIFQGRLTASGEVFDTYALTCAHKTLPFGTVVDVTRLDNGLTVRVKVNDRGPFVEGRVIDLTYAAAKQLGMLGDGTAPVRITTAGDGFAPVLFSVQVGAWGSLENARMHRLRLEDAGLSPRADLGGDGITRISFRDVAESDVFPLVDALEKLGYRDLLVRQTSP